MLSPDVRALFKPPFKLWPGRRIHDADSNTVVTWFADKPVPRGWGLIQKLPDADRRMDAWEATFNKVLETETDPAKVCELLNAAWAHGVEVADER